MRKVLLLLAVALPLLFAGCSKDEPEMKTTFSYELQRELRISNYLDNNYVDTAKVVTVYEFNDNDDIIESHNINPLKSGVKTEFTANELSTKIRVLYQFNDSYSFAKYKEKKTYNRWIEKVYFLKKAGDIAIYDDISLYYNSTRP